MTEIEVNFRRDLKSLNTQLEYFAASTKEKYPNVDDSKLAEIKEIIHSILNAPLANKEDKNLRWKTNDVKRLTNAKRELTETAKVIENFKEQKIEALTEEDREKKITELGAIQIKHHNKLIEEVCEKLKHKEKKIQTWDLIHCRENNDITSKLKQLIFRNRNAFLDSSILSELKKSCLTEKGKHEKFKELTEVWLDFTLFYRDLACNLEILKFESIFTPKLNEFEKQMTAFYEYFKNFPYEKLDLKKFCFNSDDIVKNLDECKNQIEAYRKNVSEFYLLSETRNQFVNDHQYSITNLIIEINANKRICEINNKLIEQNKNLAEKYTKAKSQVENMINRQKNNISSIDKEIKNNKQQSETELYPKGFGKPAFYYDDGRNYYRGY
jgi:hypothetical protein